MSGNDVVPRGRNEPVDVCAPHRLTRHNPGILGQVHGDREPGVPTRCDRSYAWTGRSSDRAVGGRRGLRALSCQKPEEDEQEPGPSSGAGKPSSQQTLPSIEPERYGY